MDDFSRSDDSNKSPYAFRISKINLMKLRNSSNGCTAVAMGGAVHLIASFAKSRDKVATCKARRASN
jgi:hypothetical protein